MVAVWDPKKLFAGEGAFNLGPLLKQDVYAGILKFGALFAKNGGGEEVPLKLLNRFCSSYFSGCINSLIPRGGGGKPKLGLGPGPSPCPGGNKFP